MQNRGAILLVASSGGHLLQLKQLADLWSREDRGWVTFDRPDARSLLDGEYVQYAHHPTNRDIPNLVRNVGLAVRIIARERPRAIVTTGAGVAVPFCWVGRLLGARVVYVESLTRIGAPSMTARLVAPIAHDVFVQWPQLVGKVRKARHEGTIFDLS